MKRIVFLLVAMIAMMTSCDTYQAKRDIKEYEEQNRTMKVAKIKVKHVESTCIYVAKIQYGVKFDNGAKLTSEPVFHVYKWDKYGYLSEMEDCEEKFETIEYYFPEAIYVVPFKDDKALPVISNQRMNDYLKELCELAGIDSPVHITYYRGQQRIDETRPKYELMGTHAARRTFICNAILLGIPANVIMKWTGHSDYKAMKPYIDVADETKVSAMSKFDLM